MGAAGSRGAHTPTQSRSSVHGRSVRLAVIAVIAAIAVIAVVATALGTWWLIGLRDRGGTVDGGRPSAVEAAVATWLVARNSHTPGAVARESTPDLAFLVLATPIGWGPTTSPTAAEVFERLAADEGSRVEVTGSAVMLDDTRAMYRTHAVTPSTGEDATGLAVWSVRDIAGTPRVSHVVWLPDEPAGGAPDPDPVGAVTAWLAAANGHDATALAAGSTRDLVWATMAPTGGAVSILQGSATPSSIVQSAVSDADFRFAPRSPPQAIDGTHVAAVARLVDPLHGTDATGLAVWTVRAETGRPSVSQVVWLPNDETRRPG